MMELNRIKALCLLEKEFSNNGTPVGISSVGYVNPLYSHPDENRKKKKKEKILYVQG